MDQKGVIEPCLKVRAQVVIKRTKFKDDTELAKALRDVQILLPVRERKTR